MSDTKLDALQSYLLGLENDVAIAVSGGVDSMTLAVIAHRTLNDRTTIIHAVSPAVPPQATERVNRYAAREGWRLTRLDAGEFNDERYRANPVDRCFFCKTNLYGAMARQISASKTLLSGTNLDDLGDYRPGLQAAVEHGVRHPFVETGIDKTGIRELARSLDLQDLAELPAAPCLSSRIETGMTIDPDTLQAVNRIETLLKQELNPDTVRCRVRHSGVCIELDATTLERLVPAQRQHWQDRVADLFNGKPVDFETYRRGSAFVHE
ncbi:MAG: adenine nucleotide alpha hydrolase [Candidatus Competibacteraceae bacterium]|nr:adenine nucleotide alpha hydrolase [Candidatus Competibacteraceae bacterium]